MVKKKGGAYNQVPAEESSGNDGDGVVVEATAAAAAAASDTTNDHSSSIIKEQETNGGVNGDDALEERSNTIESQKLVVSNDKQGHHPVGGTGDDASKENDNAGSMIITVDDAIERLGMGKFQLLVLIAAGLCFAADAMQVLMLSFLCEVLKIEWDLTEDETAFITSVLFTGSIFGTLVLGPLADRKGRKPVFLLAATIISMFGFAVGFVTNYWNLMAILFMVGFGVGGLTVPFDILAEFLPANSRGKNLLIIEYFWTVGVLFVVLVAHQTLGSSDANGNWRLFVVVSAIPCFVSIFIGLFFVPESARWLCTQGRCQEALNILRQAATTNGKNVDSLFPEGTQLLAEEEEESDFCELFSPRWRLTTLKLWGAWATFAFGYYGTIMVITEIFDRPTTQQSDTMLASASEDHYSLTGDKTYNFDYSAIFVSSSAELLGTTFAILTVDKVGRIPLQVVSYAMAGISVCSLCLLAARDAKRDILISLGFAARIFEMSGSCTTWVNTAEILTTEVRTTGHSAANAVARIGSLTSPFLVEGKSSLRKKGLVMLIIHTFTVFCVSQLPETKGSHFGRAHGGDEEEHALTDNQSNDEDFVDDEFVASDEEHHQIT